MVSASTRCLVLIDLQNEFLSPSGHFPIKENPDSFIGRLGPLVTTFRNAKIPVLWVVSEYGVVDIPENDEIFNAPMFDRTHLDKKACCARGTFGAQLPDLVRQLIEPEDTTVTKNWYSAFKHTKLQEQLEKLSVVEIFVVGVVTNICVSATTLAALKAGFDVTLIEDCLGWRNRQSHDKAVRDLTQAGAKLTESSRIVGTASDGPDFEATNIGLLPELFYVNGSIPSWRVMMALYEKVINF
jgi:nicotinamidase-related amidase